MKTILNSRDFIHVPQYSCYNNNYYRNVYDDRILFEEADDDHGLTYWWSNEDDMINRRYCNGQLEKIGECWMEDFNIPTQVARSHGIADEYEFEFDSEWC